MITILFLVEEEENEDNKEEGVYSASDGSYDNAALAKEEGWGCYCKRMGIYTRMQIVGYMINTIRPNIQNKISSQCYSWEAVTLKSRFRGSISTNTKEDE